MSPPRCLLTVHAHPDDEASKGAGTVARYHADGVRTVLVCCTGGEEGEILNPALDRPEVRADLAAVRRGELARSAEVIGYDEVELLGYRDSGMAGSAANANPDCFAAAPLEEATGRLVAVIRRTRPQVMVIYGDDQTGYPHPDHLRVHEVGLAAFRAAGDRARFPTAGPAFQPAKLYYTVHSAARFRAVHDKFVQLGLESPFDEEWRKRWDTMPDEVPTTVVDIADHADVRRRALLAHATQVDPESRFWFGLPPEVMATIQPHDDYRLALRGAPDGSVTAVRWDGVVETDLFAGVDGPGA
ncbi:MAG TPA: PIG-L family deacetylase [Acidimicrobiales bacterium]|nr:PIG-L family deacetylase [Acidimicrobiales bacterium]